jgi:hypothetical protein
MHGGRGGSRRAERQPFDEADEWVGQCAATMVAPDLTGEPGETLLVIGAQPALEGAEFETVGLGNLGERHAVFEVRLQQVEADERGLPLRLRQIGQRERCGRRRQGRHGGRVLRHGALKKRRH